jgi:CubicO group peptidase (beta-lactamase class C family)
LKIPTILSVLFVAIATILNGTSSAASSSQGQREDHARYRSEEKKVEQFIRSEMQERHIPGLQIVVIKHRKVILSKAFGIANVQHDIPVTQTSLFSINSATKSFTGVAIMQLAERGKVDVAAPIARYLDGLPINWQAVTLTQLLNHTSGIPNIIDRTTGKIIGGEPEIAWKTVQTLPMEFPPGQRFSYNQTNYLLLGKMIDRLSGEPFTAFIQHKQFDAVKMARSGFGDGLDVVKLKANSYFLAGDGTGLKNVNEEFPAFLRTGAGINTNATELAQWIIALQEERLLSAQSMKQLWMPTALTDGKPAPWALGWPIIRSTGHRAVAGIGGARSAFYVYPDDDLAVIILTNLAGAQPEQLIDAIAGFYVPSIGKVNGSALSVYRLRESVEKSGFDELDLQLTRLSRENTLAAPSENDLNAWGYRLLAKQRSKPAIAVLKLAATLYPASDNAHDSLGEAYEADGATELAILHYRRALELDSNSPHARMRLSDLNAKK